MINTKQNQSLHPFFNVLAWMLVLLFSTFFSWQAIQLYLAFETGFDLGVYNQVVWNTLQGHLFFYTSTGQPLLHFSNHADPILALLAPFYLIYNGPQTLLVIQAALIGLAGMPIYWLARDKLASPLAGLCCLLAYLLFPGTEVVTLSDFHPPAMAFAFLISAFYFLETRRTGWFFLFIILAMACKEQVPLQVIFLGLYALLWQRSWRVGLATIGLGAAWFVVVMYWVIPAFSVTGDHIFLDYYATFGNAPLKIVVTAITRPDLVIQSLLQPAKLLYLRDLFVPFGFLPLIGLPALLAGTPSFAINLLSVNPAMHDATRGHYVADVTPWLIFGAIFGIVYLQKLTTRYWPRSTHIITPVISLMLLTTSLTWHTFHGHSPVTLNRPVTTITAHDQLGHRFVQQIPPEAPISAQSRLYAHLSHRPIAYVFSVLTKVEYVFLDITSDTTPFHPNNYYDEVTNLLSTGPFGIRQADDGYLLLERGLENRTLPDSFYNFARRTKINPQYPVEITFGDQIQLLGYDLIDNPRHRETQVRFYWQALRPIEDDLTLYPFFLNSQNEIIEDTKLRPMTTQIWYPPRLWQSGEYVVSETLPWPLGNDWSLAVGVLARGKWADWSGRLPVTIGEKGRGIRRFEANTWARLATYQRKGQILAQILPDDSDLIPTHALTANFDNKMKLLGYDLRLEKNQAVVTLYWEALAKMGLDYTVFIHIVDAQGQPIAQQDGQPWWEVSIPTSTWQVGETLKDRHLIDLPSNLPEADYQIQVGIYYWQTLERLTVLEADEPASNFISLGSVELNK